MGQIRLNRLIRKDLRVGLVHCDRSGILQMCMTSINCHSSRPAKEGYFFHAVASPAIICQNDFVGEPIKSSTSEKSRIFYFQIYPANGFRLQNLSLWRHLAIVLWVWRIFCQSIKQEDQFKNTIYDGLYCKKERLAIKL